MDGLNKFLGKYKNLTPPEGSKQKLLIEVIRSECGITLTPPDVTIRGGGAYLHCHPTVRGEIRMCASRILSTLHQQHNTHIAFIR